MGAWGLGYRDNDNYHNRVGEFVDPLMKGLLNDWGTTNDIQDYRARLMWTFKVLSQTNESFSLTGTHMEIFRSGISGLRKVAREEEYSSEYLKVIDSEVAEIEAWLEEFKPAAPLQDRIAAIMEKEK